MVGVLGAKVGGGGLALSLGSDTKLLALAIVGIALTVCLVGVLLHRKQTTVQVDRPGLWAVTGRMGGGKTYFLSWLGLSCMAKGRPVFANYHLKGATLLRDWADVVAVPDGSVVLLAELQLWWPSDVSYGPPDVEAWVHQIRHHKITCVFDTQNWTFVSTRFRKLAYGVWEGSPMAGGHQYTLYDAYGYVAHHTSSKKRTARMQVRRTKEVMAAYDTSEDVEPNMEWAEGKRRNTSTRVTTRPLQVEDRALGLVGDEGDVTEPWEVTEEIQGRHVRRGVYG